MIQIENYKIIPIGRCKDLSIIVKEIYYIFKYKVVELGKYGG